MKYLFLTICLICVSMPSRAQDTKKSKDQKEATRRSRVESEATRRSRGNREGARTRNPKTTEKEGAYVIVMDGKFPDIIYDKSNRDQQRSNAQEIAEILEGAQNRFSPTSLTTSFDWGATQFDHIFGKLKPDLIILHWSAFYSPPHIKLDKDPFDVFFERLNYYCQQSEGNNQKVPKILVYSRSSHFQEPAKNEKFKQMLIKKAPCISNGLGLLWIRSFKRDEERSKLLNRISILLRD